MGASIFLVKMKVSKKLRIALRLHSFTVVTGMHLEICWMQHFCLNILSYMKR